jgi:hypothetical protein
VCVCVFVRGGQVVSPHHLSTTQIPISPLTTSMYRSSRAITTVGPLSRVRSRHTTTNFVSRLFDGHSLLQHSLCLKRLSRQTTYSDKLTLTLSSRDVRPASLTDIVKMPRCCDDDDAHLDGRSRKE